MAEDYLRKWVQNLWGDDPIPEELLPIIERLITPSVVELEHIQKIHDWLDSLRLSKQCGRIVAPPRAGKSVTCDVYKLLNKPQKRTGKRDIVPVLYMQVPGDCSAGELLTLILESLKYDATSGKLTDLRRRVEVKVDRLSEMLQPLGVTMKPRPIRLCAACYAEQPCHRIEWQFKEKMKCDRHQLRLLTKCTNCETPFPIPADWVQGQCPHCFLPFATMAKRQKRL